MAHRHSVIRWTALIALVVLAGIWSIRTIRFQAELFPIFPQSLESVRGLEFYEKEFASAQEVTVVFPATANLDAATKEKLIHQLGAHPGIASVMPLLDKDPRLLAEWVGWMVAHLPAREFQEFQKLFAPEQLKARLQETQAGLAGAIDPESLMRLQVDPLNLTGWLQDHANLKLPMPSMNQEPALTVLNVRSSGPLDSFEQCQQFIDTVRASLRANLPTNTPFYITGRPAFVAENSRQMKHDMLLMAFVAGFLVSAAFYLCYRSFLPLVAILVIQGLSILCGIVAARIIFGQLNVITMGFSTILLGVGMDYCILVYHFWSGAMGEEAWPSLRRGIWISAITTAAAFGVLYFASFPGFKQLAVLIAVGLITSAWFATDLLPLAFAFLKFRHPDWLLRVSDKLAEGVTRRRRIIIWVWVVAFGIFGVVFLRDRHYPFYTSDLEQLKPPAGEAAQGLKLLMDAQGGNEPFPVIVSGRSAEEIQTKIGALEKSTATDLSSSRMSVPLSDDESINRTQWTLGLETNVQREFAEAGFEENWSRTMIGLLHELDQWKKEPQVFSRVESILATVWHRDEKGVSALVRIPSAVRSPVEIWNQVRSVDQTALPASWRLMGSDLNGVAKADLKRLSFWMLLALVFLCWWAHRSWRLVALNGVALITSLIGLAALLFITQQSMTLMSLLAVPLLIGLIIDYSLHLLLAMEESDGDLRVAFEHLAVPVSLTGITSMIGFGAPMTTQQPALQNFGFVMDLGVLSAVSTGLFFLPAVYLQTKPTKRSYSRGLYRACWFEAANRIIGWLGREKSRTLARFFGWLYAATHPQTRARVRGNLQRLDSILPVKQLAWSIFPNYASTLTDYFVQGSADRSKARKLARERIGFEHLQKVHEEGRGAILACPHLSLFELGGVVMDELGFTTVAVSLPEPSAALTKWRTDFRKRWNMETLEIGTDTFAFLPIIKQLNAGKFVAILVDRPASENRVPVQYKGGTVWFSTGPVLLALLAEAPVVPVTVVALPNGDYRLEAQPPIYPRWQKDRAATLEFYTEQVARAFEPILCQYPDQWYHFGSLP